MFEALETSKFKNINLPEMSDYLKQLFISDIRLYEIINKIKNLKNKVTDGIISEIYKIC